MNRQEHLEWSRERALKLAGSDPEGAVTSMFSDLSNSPEAEGYLGAIEFGMMLMVTGNLSTASSAREFIEGFN